MYISTNWDYLPCLPLYHPCSSLSPQPPRQSPSPPKIGLELFWSLGLESYNSSQWYTEKCSELLPLLILIATTFYVINIVDISHFEVLQLIVYAYICSACDNNLLIQLGYCMQTYCKFSSPDEFVLGLSSPLLIIVTSSCNVLQLVVLAVVDLVLLTSTVLPRASH